MRYATVWRGSAISVYEGGQPDGADVEAPAEVGVGWRFDGQAWTEGSPRKWTALEFALRLTKAERSAIRAASFVSADLADFLQLAQSAQEVNETDPLFRQAIDALEAAGFLTPARVAEVLQ
jgi:hypothetical protein